MMRLVILALLAAYCSMAQENSENFQNNILKEISNLTKEIQLLKTDDIDKEVRVQALEEKVNISQLQLQIQDETIKKLSAEVKLLQFHIKTTEEKGSLVLVVTGGTDRPGIYHQTDSQVIDLSSTEQCSNLPSYPLRLVSGIGGIIDGSPLICGGNAKFDGTRPGEYIDENVSFCYKYNKTSQTWNQHGNMNKKRKHAASAIVGDSLWAIGGRGRNNHDSTEFIHPNGTVTIGPTMEDDKNGPCAVSLHDGRVMIMGGWPRYNRKTVLMYEPIDETFTTQPSLIYERIHAACTLFLSPLHNNRPVVLIAGGSRQVTAEIYDYTKSNAWEEIEKLPTAHESSFGGAKALPSLSGKGAIIQHYEHLYELECNTSSCKWRIMVQKLKKSVNFAVMMYLPPDYIC